jgi:hypothetical protein
MKCLPLLVTILVALSPELRAQTQPHAKPPVEAHLQVSKQTPFVKETVTIFLDIISRDIEIDPQVDLANLPPGDVMQMIGPFETLAVHRERTDNQEITRRRYRTTARALKPGRVELAPVLQATARQRVRSFFGSTIELRPVRLQIPPITLHINPIPTPPEDFSGIIGTFSLSAAASPREITAGDLVTITTTLRGEGWIPDDPIPPIPANEKLKAYRVRPLATEDRPQTWTFTQTLVPMAETIKEIPATTLVWFHTGEGAFRTETLGPFPLQFIRDTAPHAMTEEATTQQRLQAETFVKNRIVPVPDTTRAYLAPASTSKPIFTIPPTGTIRILQSRDNWLLIDYDQNRGWIPASALP